MVLSFRLGTCYEMSLYIQCKVGESRSCQSPRPTWDSGAFRLLSYIFYLSVILLNQPWYLLGRIGFSLTWKFPKSFVPVLRFYVSMNIYNPVIFSLNTVFLKYSLKQLLIMHTADKVSRMSSVWGTTQKSTRSLKAKTTYNIYTNNNRDKSRNSIT